jgi:hypothetical protein
MKHNLNKLISGVVASATIVYAIWIMQVLGLDVGQIVTILLTFIGITLAAYVGVPVIRNMLQKLIKLVLGPILSIRVQHVVNLVVNLAAFGIIVAVMVGVLRLAFN